MKKRVDKYPIGVYYTVWIFNTPMGYIRRADMEKTKERTDQEYKDLMNRLKRIEGQVRGIQGMLEKDAYCTDVLVQVAAVNAALNSFSKALLDNHIRTCVAENIRAGNDEVIDELVILLQKLMK